MIENQDNLKIKALLANKILTEKLLLDLISDLNKVKQTFNIIHASTFDSLTIKYMTKVVKLQNEAVELAEK